MNLQKVYAMPFADVYPLYVRKAERKGRTREEVDQVICWLTGHTGDSLRQAIVDRLSLEAFFDQAPGMNPGASMIKGVICGYRVEDIQEETMQKIRWMDKLVDELAKGRPMEKILRK